MLNREGTRRRSLRPRKGEAVAVQVKFETAHLVNKSSDQLRGAVHADTQNGKALLIFEVPR